MWIKIKKTGVQVVIEVWIYFMVITEVIVVLIQLELISLTIRNIGRGIIEGDGGNLKPEI